MKKELFYVVFCFGFLLSVNAQTSSSVKKIGARGSDLQVLGGLLADSVLKVPVVSDTSGGKRLRKEGSVLQYRDSLYYFDGKGFRAIGPGAQGPKGEKGDAGAPGPAGPQGDRGETGPAGAKGERGEQGATGLSGVAGPQGTAGVKGERGEQGATGPAGVAGPQGPAGAKGEKGDTGATGATGPAGPIGPTGPVGPQGAKGDAGPKGDKGDAGATGVAGPRGERGETGPQGVKGDAGPVGPRGEKGEKGDRGPQGPKRSERDTSIYFTDGTIKEARVVTVLQTLHLKKGTVTVDKLKTKFLLAVPHNQMPPETDKTPPGALFTLPRGYDIPATWGVNVLASGSTPAHILYYSDGTNYVPLWQTPVKTLYSDNDTIRTDRTVTLNGKKLYFKGSGTDKGLVLKGENVGVGVSEPQKNLHTKGSVRIEGNGAKSNHVLTATNNQGDVQWRQPRNIYTTDDTIKMTSGVRVVTIPNNTKIRFVGQYKYTSSGYSTYSQPKSGRAGSTLQFQFKAGGLLPEYAPPNSVVINQSGNLSVIGGNENFDSDIRSTIPFFISNRTNSAGLYVYANKNPTFIHSSISPTGYSSENDISNFSHTGVKRLTTVGTGSPRIFNNFKALISGDVLIEGGSLTITSDRRIKKVRCKAPQSESVRRLKNLNVYHYQFKDTLAKGNKMMSGVLAQEVQKVMPEAVFQLPGSLVPDIYKSADSIRNTGNNTRVYLSVPLNPDSLKVGTELKFYLYNKTERRKILKVAKNYIEVPYLCEENADVFVYGSFVNDLLNVDHNQIFMENLNVTKYLLQRQEEQEDTIRSQQERIDILEKKLQEQRMATEQELKEQKKLLEKVLQHLKVRGSIDP